MPDNAPSYYNRLACPVCGGDNAHDEPWPAYERPRGVLPNRLDQTLIAPLNLLECHTCSHLYLRELVEPAELFPPDYNYKAGTVDMQSRIFRDFVDAVERRTPIDTAAIIDIGANDGSLLRHFDKKTDCLFAVDPATPELPSRRSPHGMRPAITVFNEFWSQAVAGQILAQTSGRTRIVTMTNTLAQLPKVHEAIGAIASLMGDDDLCVIQAPWALAMLEQGIYDTIYHEHYHYWTLKALRRLVQQHMLDVFDVDYLPNVHGGSLRYFVGRPSWPKRTSLELVEAHEERLSTTADAFGAVCRAHERVLAERLASYDSFWAYGASAKGVILLNALAQHGVRPTMVFDDAQTKIWCDVPGLSTIITPGSTFPSTRPFPEAILLTAWNYASRLVPSLRAAGYPNDIILPFPTPYAY